MNIEKLLKGIEDLFWLCFVVPAVSIDREHFNLELIYVEVICSEKLASMIVCNSKTIREMLQDTTLKYDFRFSYPRVIVELFYALRNETSVEEVESSFANVALRG